MMIFKIIFMLTNIIIKIIDHLLFIMSTLKVMAKNLVIHHKLLIQKGVINRLIDKSYKSKLKVVILIIKNTIQNSSIMMMI